MRFATIRTPEGTRAARVEPDHYVELGVGDVGALLQQEPDALARAAAMHGAQHPLGSVDLAPVVTAPGKIVCCGVNYLDHIAEMGREAPPVPTLFAKYADALLGPCDDLELPPESDAVDWEVELAVVIGAPVRRVSEEQAAAAIAGFTVANDVSMRDWQNRTTEWLQGKTWERSTPLGPVLVTPDELGGTAPDLVIRCEVDDEVRQESRTGLLLFGPARIVAHISTFVTLRPGDVVLTGTPGGVGHGRTPPVHLEAGQLLRSTIEGIGELGNRCVAPSA